MSRPLEFKIQEPVTFHAHASTEIADLTSSAGDQGTVPDAVLSDNLTSPAQRSEDAAQSKTTADVTAATQQQNQEADAKAIHLRDSKSQPSDNASPKSAVTSPKKKPQKRKAVRDLKHRSV